MNLSFAFPAGFERKEMFFLAILISTAIAGGAIAFPLTFLTKTNELIGICLLPFVLKIQSGKRFNYLFFLSFVFFEVLALIYSVRIFYFFALAFYMLWLVEIFFGKVNPLIIFLLGFMSPIFSQVSAILGFPIRLQLSHWAGMILTSIGLTIQIEGNMILVNGAVFSVDEACMGLNMLAISMLMGVFILARNGGIVNKALDIKYLILFFLICLVLNIGANLFRIIILVLFKIEPENPMHEIIGMLCLIAYVMMPLSLFGKWMIQKLGYKPKFENNTQAVYLISKSAHVLIAAGILFTGILVNKKRMQLTTAHAHVVLPGFEATNINDGITKLVNDAILIYVKPIPEFFTGEHTPLLCWKGSGYSFKAIRKSEVYGHKIYYGQLVKKSETLFTAWWYSNGKIQTISQLDWRIRMMAGEDKFSLINVTSNEEVLLTRKIKEIFEKKNLLIKY